MNEDPTTPPPATDAAEAQRQAREIRARVDQDLRALESRMPDPATVRAQAKTIGGAAAGGIAAIAAVVVVLRRRSASRAQEKEVRRQAEALAAALPEAALQVRREEVTVSAKAGRLGLLVALAALGVAVWSRLSSGRDEPEPDIWGPAPDA